MYRFSRSIYRELAPRIGQIEDVAACSAARQNVIEASEATMRRMAYDRRYFARPARSLFNEIRVHFGLNDQLKVWNVVDSNIKLALIYLEQMPEDLDFDGQPRECRAHTRKGTPCQRQPLPARDYCPSHKHLEETFESATITEELLGQELIAA